LWSLRAACEVGGKLGGPLDVIHKLYCEGQVCLLKFNPANDYTGVFFEHAFADLIRNGFVATAYGGADVGEYLCWHDGIEEIHITGSHRTHDVIVWGSGEEGATNRGNGRPRLRKRITSELGNVSPVIVVPGDWSPADLRFHAERLVPDGYRFFRRSLAGLSENGSFGGGCWPGERETASKNILSLAGG